MTANHFIWTDLSTFDVATAQADYAALFGWRYDQTFDQSISDSYHMAMQGDAPAAGLFQMPEFFQKIKMPSFWMSYVHVENLEDTLAQARQFDGAIVEIEPTAFDGESRIALLRDPAGAGFTLYEGPEMGGAADICDRIWHGGDVTQVRAFYETLFGWDYRADGPSRWQIHAPDGTRIATVAEVGADVRGKFTYWMPVFAVADPAGITDRVAAQGGGQFATLEDGTTILHDRQGAGFAVRTVAGQATPEPASAAHRSFSWRTWGALAAVWLAVVMDWQVFWAVLFLIWCIPALRHGETFFVEPIQRKRSPFTFWALIGTWVVLSLLTIVYTFV